MREVKSLPLEELCGWIELNAIELEEKEERDRKSPKPKAPPGRSAGGAPTHLRSGRRRRMPDGSPVVESSEDG